MIDSHQHFWRYDPPVQDWIDESMSVIRRDFLPGELQPLLMAQGVSGCVAVQADQSEKETDFLLELAADNDFIRGVVGWVDLRSDRIRERLEHYSKFPILKGFRHVLQGEEPGFMLTSGFLRGIAALNEFGYTYDILVLPRHLEAAIQLVRRFPEQLFVIDHIAKPGIKAGSMEPWKKGMQDIAKYPNVFCKLSGMVTEADWQKWEYEDFIPYLNCVTEAFGTNRLMYGSDWPVCLVASDYTRMFDIVKKYFSGFGEPERQAVLSGNAKRFYNI